jgi:hypothetical protein
LGRVTSTPQTIAATLIAELLLLLLLPLWTIIRD